MRTKPVNVSDEGPQFGVDLKYQKDGAFCMLTSASAVYDGDKLVGWIANCKQSREWLAWRNVNGTPILWTVMMKSRQDALTIGFDPNEPRTYGVKSRFG